MAAGQRKKRLNSASGVGYTSREQHSMKRKKLISQQYDSSIRSNIILEWDDKGKSVVAKKEQVGIAQRDLSPFFDAVPSCHNILASIVDIPHEIFEFEDLTKVLSFEVWQTHLSEKERNLLTQFLPKGFEAQQVVQELLEGDNFHFGNPFMKWGASLCSGDLHPDIILNKERLLKATKKAYYSELQNYHYDMIRDLQILKGRWSQKDPENDLEQNLWRSRKRAEKTLAAHANKYTLHDFDNNLTYESCSSASDDKACSSNELNFRSLHGDSQRRNGFMEDIYDNASDGVKVVPRQRKGEKLQKCNIQSGDGAKYMSYIKVSKEQHQRVKSSMKHSSNSIQSRSLNHVLGDLGTYCVQPYKVFEEEERQKLHVHWSKLATVDIAAALINLRSRQKEKWQLMHALGQEIVEKINYLKEDEEKKFPSNMSSDQVGDGESDPEPSISTEDEGSEISNCLLQEKINNAATNHDLFIALEDGEHGSSDGVFQQHTNNAAAINKPVMDDKTESVSTLAQNHHLQPNTSLGGNHIFHTMNLVSDETLVIPEPDNLLPNVSNFTESLSQVDVPRSRENPLSVACDVWPEVSLSNAYYNSTHISHDYASANALSHANSQVIEEHPTQLINLNPDMRKPDHRKDLLSRPSDDIFFSSYPNQVQNEQLQSFFKGPGSVQYHHEQKPTMLDFQPLSNVLIENSPPVGDFREQLHPSMALDLRQKRFKDPFMHQSIQENMYLDGLRHALPRQDHFVSPLASSNINMHSWGASSVQLPGLSQSHPNGGELLSQNWISVENQARGGWPGLEATVCQNQSFGTGSIADQSFADQSLFSVLSQANNLNLSAGPHTSLAPQERFNQSLNYSGGVVPATSNLLPRMVNQHSYLNGHDYEATNGPKANNTGWTSLPNQNTVLHDSMGKPYLRYWNH